MIYQEIPEFDKEHVLAELNSEDPDRIVMALLSIVLNGDDYDFSLKQIVKFAVHENEYVRGCVVESIGHLSRLYPIKLNPIITDRIINAGKHDTSEWVRRKTYDALDDIELFEGKK